MAVKKFKDHVSPDLVKWEADVLNLFDHPGTVHVQIPLVYNNQDTE